MLNIKLLLPSRHLVGLINQNRLCSRPSFPKTELGFYLEPNQWGCATISNQKGLCDERGGLCFLPSMTPGLGIIQLLCESSSHLSLTVCPARPVGSGLLSEAS